MKFIVFGMYVIFVCFWCVGFKVIINGNYDKDKKSFLDDLLWYFFYLCLFVFEGGNLFFSKVLFVFFEVIGFLRYIFSY